MTMAGRWVHLQRVVQVGGLQGLAEMCWRHRPVQMKHCDDGQDAMHAIALGTVMTWRFVTLLARSPVHPRAVRAALTVR